ncbi:MAG: DUF2306 domain-containing protein [Proteobacteria bacterium]|nr:DUF2306 domain-containing protein [Pseudomonadota bacterium]
MMHWPMGYVHVVSALAALGSGTLIVLLRKGSPLHRLIGIAFSFAMLTVNMSALMLYNMTGHFGPFHALALVSLICTVMGLAMPALKPRDWLKRHAVWMGRSYIGLLAAALAEALVRVPALHIDSAAKSFEVGIAAAIFFGLAGFVLIPAFKRAALRHGEP